MKWRAPRIPDAPAHHPLLVVGWGPWAGSPQEARRPARGPVSPVAPRRSVVAARAPADHCLPYVGLPSQESRIFCLYACRGVCSSVWWRPARRPRRAGEERPHRPTRAHTDAAKAGRPAGTRRPVKATRPTGRWIAPAQRLSRSLSSRILARRPMPLVHNAQGRRGSRRQPGRTTHRQPATAEGVERRRTDRPPLPEQRQV
jgi:hypothetical protein